MRDNKGIYTIVVLAVMFLIELKFEIITLIFRINISNLRIDPKILISVIYTLTLVVLGLILLHGSKPKRIFKEIGTYKRKSSAILFIIFFVCSFMFYFILNELLEVGNVTFFSFILLFGIAIEKEIFLRGFVLGQLFRNAKWGFIPAVSIYPIIVLIKDLILKANSIEAFLQFADLLLLSAWLSWMYIEWNYNIWFLFILNVIIGYVSLMFNIEAIAFNIESLYQVIIQIVIIAISVVLTLHHNRRKSKRFKINSKNLFLQP